MNSLPFGGMRDRIRTLVAHAGIWRLFLYPYI
jgi:hypothetical protein